MMWFKQLLAKWVRDANRDEIKTPRLEPARGSATISRGSEDDDLNFKKPLNIVLYNVNGGRLVKFWKWNNDHEEMYESIYFIDNDEDFADSLSKFIAMEGIKHV